MESLYSEIEKIGTTRGLSEELYDILNSASPDSEPQQSVQPQLRQEQAWNNSNKQIRASSSSSSVLPTTVDVVDLTTPEEAIFTTYNGRENPVVTAVKEVNNILQDCGPPPPNLPFFDNNTVEHSSDHMPFYNYGFSGFSSAVQNQLLKGKAPIVLSSHKNKGRVQNYGTTPQLQPSGRGRNPFQISSTTPQMQAFGRGRNPFQNIGTPRLQLSGRGPSLFPTFLTTSWIGSKFPVSLITDPPTNKIDVVPPPLNNPGSTADIDAIVKFSFEEKIDLGETNPRIMEKKLIGGVNGGEGSERRKDTPYVLYSRRPVISGSKMTDKIKQKCKNVIADMQWKVIKKGKYFVPDLAYHCTRQNNVLEFEKLGQKLDENKYAELGDLIDDFISMFKDAAKEFTYSELMLSEVWKVHECFGEMMKSQFPAIEIPKKLEDTPSPFPRQRFQSFYEKISKTFPSKAGGSEI